MCKPCVMPKPTTPGLIGSAQAAEILSIDRSTLTRWVKSNKIAPSLVGSGKTGEMFFSREALAALLTPTAALASPEERAS